MGNTNPINLDIYQHTLDHGGSYWVPETGFLRLDGEDQLAFLQRQTTNDLRKLSPGFSMVTILTSPTARILDVLRVYQDDGHLGILTLPGYGEQSYRYLKSRIFFMDKVNLLDLSPNSLQVDIFGPKVNIVLSYLGITDSEDHQIKTINFKGTELIVVKSGKQFGFGYRLIFPHQFAKELRSLLDKMMFPAIEHSLYEILRVEAGLPGAKAELSEEFTPLEVNYDQVISNSKGCYTGQEILARQITYDKVTRRLVGIKSDDSLVSGSKIYVEKEPAGTLTSVVRSPRFGFIGLAILKRTFNIPGHVVSIIDKKQMHRGIVCELPFSIPTE
jgi:tRNA-modifying protein YgfZ